MYGPICNIIFTWLNAFFIVLTQLLSIFVGWGGVEGGGWCGGWGGAGAGPALKKMKRGD